MPLIPLTTNDRRSAFWVFLAFISLYLATGHFILDHTDGEFMFRSMESLLDGSFELRAADLPDLGGQDKDGRMYSPFGIGQPLLAMPLYLGGLAVSKLVPQIPERVITRAAVMLFVPIVTAFTCAVIFLLLRRLGSGARTSLVGVAVFGLGTLAWPYTKTFFSNSLAGLLVLLTVWHVCRAREEHCLRSAALAGVCAALGLLVRHQLLLPAALAGLIVLLPRQRTREAWRASLSLTLRYAPSVLLALIFWGWYNWVRYGAVTQVTGTYRQEIGGTPLWRGLAILFISPGKGLLWYTPVAVLAVSGYRMLWRSHRGFAGVSLAMIGVLTLFYASISTPGGHWCWGPRFLLDLLPLAGVAIGVALSRWGGWPLWGRALCCGLIGISVAVQVLCCSVNFMHVYRRILDAGVSPQYHEFEWRYSPLVAGLAALREDIQWSHISLASARSDAPPEEFRRSLRATLDYWPAFAYRVGLPRPLLLLFPLQLLLTAYCAWRATCLARATPVQAQEAAA